MSKPSIDLTLRKKLERLAQIDLDQGIRNRFKQEQNRAEQFSFDLDCVFFDFSKTHISNELLEIYIKFAEQISFEEKRHALFSGERINYSEDRAVLHPLLRDTNNQGIALEEPEMLAKANDAQRQLFAQCEKIKSSISQKETKAQNIIHVGIGGSVLGTKLIYEALAGLQNDIRIHFVSNIDAHQLEVILAQCDPSNTIVIGVSKTFSTAETLLNIRSIGAWYEQAGIDDYWPYFYAVTASIDNAVAFGIKPENVTTFPTWIGGRYSVWSSVSLSAALILGSSKFEEFLDGAALADQHFYQTPAKHNISFIAALLDHYYVNFMQSGSKAIFAYDFRLKSLVSYLQQLETESNGKDRQLNGTAVDQKTSSIVWGGVGTDVQHSVFQMLHQGTSLIPAEFILVKTPDHGHKEHHAELLANGLAQTAALLSGQNLKTVTDLYKAENLPEPTLKAKIFSGNRPSSTIVLDRLTPKSLGIMLAFYEHRVFCSGLFANINSFDQMGVELGKRIAKKLKPEFTKKNSELGNMDASTYQLLERLKS